MRGDTEDNDGNITRKVSPFFLRNQQYKTIKLIAFFRREEAVNRPKQEFVPKTLADLHIEGLSDGLTGEFYWNRIVRVCL